MSTQDPHIASASGTPFHKPKREKVPHSSTSPTQSDIEHTNAGRMWIAVAMGAIVVIILLIFILQNTKQVAISFFAWDFELPLGVALLFAAIGGVLVMASVGGARIWQLRRAYRKSEPAPEPETDPKD
ncbi:lipopolysaccharide assembly LapA domain-containing protein [Rhodococcus sp. IEGM 1318]|uniref:LapA family protein n=1 Tax=Rhodococcus sp. IEGM 1318 TaxID=3082226 RepID=UPI002954C13E|nr:lipopolysaccharide assembly protein LapA domain-containing protein [Rhodococcus sp. IEGM 1318]MDV8009539.1 lipopolysaccharide assembly protein LapA domain-containing protein [Rhodococcus sp. IEGM 1318]